MEPKTGIFHDAQTGETVTRELTPDELAALESAQTPTQE